MGWKKELGESRRQKQSRLAKRVEGLQIGCNDAMRVGWSDAYGVRRFENVLRAEMSRYLDAHV